MQVINEMSNSSKKVRNSRYEESNVVFDKLKKYFSTASPRDSLGV